jgi:acyl carrier protein
MIPAWPDGSLDTEIVSIVIETMQRIREDQNLNSSGPIAAATRLFGSGGTFDSLALVTLVVEVERRLKSRFGVAVSLADDRAMSRESSPFLTVGSFARYAAELVEEQFVTEGKHG